VRADGIIRYITSYHTTDRSIIHCLLTVHRDDSSRLPKIVAPLHNSSIMIVTLSSRVGSCSKRLPVVANN